MVDTESSRWLTAKRSTMLFPTTADRMQKPFTPIRHKVSMEGQGSALWRLAIVHDRDVFGLFLRGHGELVGTVVSALVHPGRAGGPFALLPFHFLVARCRFEEPLPQVPVRHGPPAVVEPAVFPPLLVPAPSHAVDEVRGVGVDGHRMAIPYGLQSDAGCGYLHPQVGGVALSAADLHRLALQKRDYGPVASGTAGACRCPVGVDVDLTLGRGCRFSARLPSAHPCIASPARLPSSRTINCSRSTSSLACC